MCCRYYIEPESPELASIFETVRFSPLLNNFYQSAAKPLTGSGEVSPSMIVPVIARSRAGGKGYYPMQWGYSLEKKTLLANARLETAGQKPLFEQSWKNRRCVIPASYYFEWQHYLLPNGRKETGDRYMLQPKGEQLTWLCGLYRYENGLPHFVVITRSPSEEINFIHDRMPLMIARRDIDDWISDETSPEEVAYRGLTDIYFQKTR